MTAHLMLDVFSDIACPWCFIGKRRLEKATAGGPSVDVHWRAYQLQPNIPPEGVEAGPFFREKFGGEARLKQIWERVASVGAGEGIRFDFAGQKKVVNTRLGHEAVVFASKTGHGSHAKEALFKGNFEEGEDIGRLDVVVELLKRHEVPVDLAELRRALADGDARGTVQSDLDLGRSLGVSGVPLFVRGLDKVREGGAEAVSGAQEVAVFQSFLAKPPKATA
jgi:predicted DsbA family dithiol-disulfide isomerase